MPSLLVILLTQTLGVVGHDHGLGASAVSDCTEDHEVLERRAVSGARSDWRLERAGERHQHHCLGCHLSRVRSSSGNAAPMVESADSGRGHALALAAADLLAGSARFSLARGPPAA